MQEGEVQRRQQVLTDKGAEYQLEVRTKNFKLSVSQWRRKANKLRAALIDDTSFSDVKVLRDGLQKQMDDVIVAQENLSSLQTDDDTSDEILDEVEKDHSLIMKGTLERMVALKNAETNDESSKHGDNHEPPPLVSPVAPPPTTAFVETSSHIAEQLRASRLPLPEPTIFDGNPLSFPGWKHAFDVLIDHSGVKPMDRFFYLEKYLKGQPRELVQGYALIDTETAYFDARKALEERYGNPFVIANAFRDKIEKWPRIGSKDAPGLRRFSDFLRQCDSAMEKFHHLRHLNDDREIRKILAKLPEWLVARWSRRAYQWAEDNNSFPPFKLFVRFIEEEAKIACCPITSVYGLRESKLPSEARALVTKSGPHQKEGYESKRGNGADCLACGRHHVLDECPVFSTWVMEKKKMLIRERGLCFGCLKAGHRSKECKKRSTCNTCRKRHPTALHIHEANRSKDQSSRQPLSQDTTNDEVRSSSSHTARKCDAREVIKSSMIVPVWLSHPSISEPRLVYALLDTQSDTTFVLNKTKQAMGLRGTSVSLRLSTMSTVNEKVTSMKVEGLEVTSYDGKNKVCLPPAFTREMIPADRNHIPTSDMAASIPHLSKLQHEIPTEQMCEIGLLIGYDCSKALMPRDVIPSLDSDGRFGVLTDLGWSIVGTVDKNYDGHPNDPIGVSHRVKVCVVSDDIRLPGQDEVSFSHRRLVKEEIAPNHIAKLLEADFMQGKESKPYSQNDVKFLKLMEEGIHVTEGGQYEMPLPFRDDVSLPNNRFLAEKRLNHLKMKFLKNPEYHEVYTQKMTSLFEKNYAEVVSDEGEEGKVWYIPHHGVQQPNKLRVVFDCSAKLKGESLNDHLLTGPDLTNTLTGVLCRFRLESQAFICDVQEMFHRFRVNPGHRDFLRFLWWPNGNLNQEPADCRMNVHLFGAASSPGCSNFALKQIAKDNAEEFGQEAAEFICRDFYVDDGLKSVTDEDNAVKLITNTRKICERGGLHLHKFVSNSRKVLQSVPPEDRSKEVKELNLLQDTLPVERALGVQWCIESDSFRFRITLNDKPATRRGVLSTIMSVYDPLGLLAPVILPGKQILQELCRCSFGWDDQLDDVLKMRWERWRISLLQVEKLSVQRCYKPENFGQIQSMQLHHFCDASSTGYGQCSYIRLTNVEEKVHCALIMGKSRVTPLKSVTIPRLELTAAVVSIRISLFLTKELGVTSAAQYFWTDSRVVLSYIANEDKRFHVFVANRVKEIKDGSTASQWHHVESKENPADAASRGLRADQLESSTWLTGPRFLWEKETPSDESEEEFTIQSDDPEVKKAQSHQANTQQKGLGLDRLNRFSTWHQARRAVANCIRLKGYLKERCDKGNESNSIVIKPMSMEILSQAEKEILKNLQREEFPQEIETLKRLRGQVSSIREHRRHVKKACPFEKLDPFLDDEDVLRVGGRLSRCEMSFEEKHPILLPKKSHVTKLIVRHCHDKVAHQGRGMTMNELRASGYWILGCNSIVSNFIANCVTCRRLRRSPEVQKMADLPRDRVTPSPPFSYCGMDCFGPWLIKEGRKEVKRYGIIFTCMASRAVHIETLNSMTTDAFMNALRRFISVRGPIRQLRCDQGTNFVGGEAELRKNLKEMDHDSVKNHLLKEGCDYKYVAFSFNPPSASHMGGIWERQICSIRRVLEALLQQHGRQLHDEALRTLMCEAMAIVNSRPLSVDCINDVTSPEPLSPNHILTQKSKVILPPPGNFLRHDVYLRKYWRRVQYLANQFWSRWQRDYLNNLQSRQKWTRPKREMKVGDIVIIKDDDLPRNVWSLGRIVEVYPSSDHHVRKVKLAIGQSKLCDDGKRPSSLRLLDRPIHKLVLILPQEEQE